LRRALPELPAARAQRLIAAYGITASDADTLTADVLLADYFETAAKTTKYPKLLANLLLTDVMRVCGSDPFSSPVDAAHLSAVAELFGDGVINSATAKKLIARLATEAFDPVEVVERESLAQIRDSHALQELIDGVLADNPRAVSDYRGGKTAAMRALQGQAMARCAGRADPILLERLLRESLEV